MRRAALAVAGMLAVAAPAVAATGAGARVVDAGARGDDVIPLLAPVRNVDPLAGALGLGLRKDRLLKSVVPGPVRNTEQLTVAVGPDGTPAAVTDDQQLTLTGAGAYIVRELGPARKADGIGDTVPPVLELGQVVWQGFSPGSRTLRARLALDPAIEAHRLPMAVSLQFRDRRGRTQGLGAGGAAPVDGTVVVTLTNQTGSPRTLAAGTADVRPLATALDRLYRAALAPHAAVPPYAGGGLPTAVRGVPEGDQQATVVAPLRVTGAVGAADGAAAVVRGPGTTPGGRGATVSGSLEATATFEVDLHAGQHLALDLDVRPWPDPRTLVPPVATWLRWAAAKPTADDVRSATSTLVAAAAASARAAEYSPYLQADTRGDNLSSFRYVVAAAARAPRAGEALRPKAAGIAAAVLALLAIAGNAALLWRRL